MAGLAETSKEAGVKGGRPLRKTREEVSVAEREGLGLGHGSGTVCRGQQLGEVEEIEREVCCGIMPDRSAKLL